MKDQDLPAAKLAAELRAAGFPRARALFAEPTVVLMGGKYRKSRELGQNDRVIVTPDLHLDVNRGGTYVNLVRLAGQRRVAAVSPYHVVSAVKVALLAIDAYKRKKRGAA